MSEDVSPPELPVDSDLSPTVDIFRRRQRRPRRWDIVIVIAAGGAIGGGARYLLNHVMPAVPGEFPWSTFIENTTGCLLLGFVMVYLLDVWRPRRYARPFIGIGILGGYTTFSTYSADTRALMLEGRGALALTYMFGTLLVCLLATWTGLNLARSFAGINPPHNPGRDS